MTNLQRFTGQVAMVTGAGHGIGRAVAERFAAEGASVIVNDLDPARAAQVAAEIGRDIPGSESRILPLAADVSRKSAVDAMFDAALERFATLDVLVNNAGNIYAARHFLEGDEAWWDGVLGVNLKGAFLCSLRAAQLMVRRRSGAIVNMSSGGATRAHRGNVAYDASKGGIEAMTRAMALDLAPYGVRVNAIVPGLIQTYDLSAADAVERGSVVPMGRLGTPEDLAGPTVFLATEDARYITGACLVVDGGVLVQQRSTPVDTFPLSRFPKIE
jgi:NAD(P)-dependent dehydrogenase (short-subunit alcohol dehydrogenase family)